MKFHATPSKFQSLYQHLHTCPFDGRLRPSFLDLISQGDQSLVSFLGGHSPLSSACNDMMDGIPEQIYQANKARRSDIVMTCTLCGCEIGENFPPEADAWRNLLGEILRFALRLYKSASYSFMAGTVGMCKG